GVFSLQSVSVNGATSNNYSLEGQWLTVNLDANLQPGQAVGIGLAYQLNLPYSSAKFENFGYTARQTNLIDWFPFVPPNIGGQWILPNPYSFGENLVYDKADFRVSLTFADPSSAPVVAASAPGRLENGALVFSLPNARNFTISVSPEYLVSTADANGVTIYNYYYASNANAAAMVLELTRMSVNTYSAEFGAYPHTALSVCETDLNDGLETDGLYFLASSFYLSFDGSVRNNLSTIAVHETAHQWWYGAVANNQAVEPWLDEALATYSEHVFYEDNYPDLLAWWWNFRVNSHGPSGWVDSQVYDTSNFRAYVNAVYFNGAIFLQALRDRVGDQIFFAFIRDYFARNNGRIASASDFFAILSLHTNSDISDLVRSYFQYR
ncbi:MAG: M1 family aminopeptidase, partial [Chloroflexi bacterium]|nr:M1 family aminopeptidase [Chloroflexota bacterium]